MIGRTNINGINDASGVGAVLSIDAPTGSTVTVSQGSFSKVLRNPIKISIYSSRYFYLVKPTKFGSWTVTATLGTDTASDTVTIGSNEQYDLSLSYNVPSGYQEVKYLAVGNTSGPHIITSHTPTNNDEYEVTFQYTGVPDNNTWLFGSYAPNRDTMFGYYNSVIRLAIGGNNLDVGFDTGKHTFLATRTNMILDDVTQSVVPNWNSVAPYALAIFGSTFGSNSVAATKNVRIFRVKIWTGGDLVGDFIPCYRKSDSLPGMWDAAGESFYMNAGSGTFILGPNV